MKQTVNVQLDTDKDRLYGNLDEAIKYLQEVKEQYENARLHEHWTGYEDMEMVFEYTRYETDAEYANRLEREENERQSVYALRAKKEKREAILKEIDRLKCSLNSV
jgi:hypothetical protein